MLIFDLAHIWYRRGLLRKYRQACLIALAAALLISTVVPAARRPYTGMQHGLEHVDVDGRPTLVFEVADFNDARSICMDDVLGADLSTLTADGFSICLANSRLQARSASPTEVIAFEHAVGCAPPSNEPTMAFLIKVDGVVVVKIDPPS